MSTCISREGEYGSHKFGTNGAERFTCRRCWVFDEEAAYAALTAAESRLASVEALADEWDVPWSHTFTIGEWETRQDCAVALRAVLGSDAHTEQKGTDPAEARQKVAEALFSMGFEAPWIYVDAVFAALGSQEQP